MNEDYQENGAAQLDSQTSPPSPGSETSFGSQASLQLKHVTLSWREI